jgi:hypothetical protein
MPSGLPVLFLAAFGAVAGFFALAALEKGRARIAAQTAVRTALHRGDGQERGFKAVTGMIRF